MTKRKGMISFSPRFKIAVALKRILLATAITKLGKNNFISCLQSNLGPAMYPVLTILQSRAG